MSKLRILFGALVAAVLLVALPAGSASAAPGPQQSFTLTVHTPQGTTLATATGWVAYDTSGTSAQYSITACGSSSSYGSSFLSVSNATTYYFNYGCQTYSGTASAGGAHLATVTVSLTAGTFVPPNYAYTQYTRSATLYDPF